MQDTEMKELVRFGPKMAHRLRDRLAVIQIATEYLINDKSISEDAREKIATINEQLETIAREATSFLIITDHQNIGMAVVDLRNLLLCLTELFNRLLGENIILQIVPDHNLWPVQSDIDRLEDIFLTLAVNARDAMPNGGTLRILAKNIPKTEREAAASGATDGADYVLIQFIDSGVGIPKGDLGQIFDPFFSPNKQSGFGFALARAYAHIKELNGFVKVQSEAGSGTTFSIFLPRSCALE